MTHLNQAPKKSTNYYLNMFSSSSSANPLDDVEVPNSPSDGISHLEFSPKANHLIASSWDGQVNTVGCEIGQYILFLVIRVSYEFLIFPVKSGFV